MKHRILFVSALTALTFSVNAQVVASVSSSDIIEATAVTEARPSTTNAQFPGGGEALAEYLEDNLEYSEEARSNAIEGIVMVEFLVQDDGRLSDFKIIKTPNDVLCASALATLKGMSEWIPASHNGLPVASRVKLPLHFGLR